MTDTIKRILADEEVEDYVAPEVARWSGQAPELADTAAAEHLRRRASASIASMWARSERAYCSCSPAALFRNRLAWDLIKIVTGKFTDKNGNVIQRN